MFEFFEISFQTSIWNLLFLQSEAQVHVTLQKHESYIIMSRD